VAWQKLLRRPVRHTAGITISLARPCRIIWGFVNTAFGMWLAVLGPMPEISRFHGIVIRMFAEPGARHHRPHFHAIYREWAVSFAIDTLEVLGGGLPTRQMHLVEVWADMHRAELIEDWSRLRSGQPPVKIEPLP